MISANACATAIGSFWTFMSLLPGDFDRHVDMDDHTHLQPCYNSLPVPPACQDARLDGDLDVADLNVFMSDAGVFPPVGCAN